MPGPSRRVFSPRGRQFCPLSARAARVIADPEGARQVLAHPPPPFRSVRSFARAERQLGAVVPAPVRGGRQRRAEHRLGALAAIRHRPSARPGVSPAPSTTAGRSAYPVRGGRQRLCRASPRAVELARAEHPLGAVAPARCVVAASARAEPPLGAVAPARCVAVANVRAERLLGAPREWAHWRARAGASDLVLVPARCSLPGRERARQGQASVTVYP